MRKGLLSFVFLIAACASQGYRITDQNMALADVKKSVESAIGEPREVSRNQRVYLTQYFSRKPDPKFDPEKSRERLYAKVSVLGDRRPYDVEVEVIVEEREGSQYLPVATDMTEAKKLGKEIRIKLNQSRDDRNVIDDFRAF